MKGKKKEKLRNGCLPHTRTHIHTFTYKISIDSFVRSCIHSQSHIERSSALEWGGENGNANDEYRLHEHAVQLHAVQWHPARASWRCVYTDGTGKVGLAQEGFRMTKTLHIPELIKEKIYSYTRNTLQE